MKVLLIFLIEYAITSNITENDDVYKQKFITRTGSAEIYESDIDGKKFILKYFTDEMRRTRETNISKTIARLNLKCANHFHEIKKHIVMKKIIGYELKDYLQMKFKNEEKYRSVITQIFNGILELHSAGIVHADINKRNVMVDADEKVHLIDYGESWVGNDFYFDYVRVKHSVLDLISREYEMDWRNLIDYDKITNSNALKLMINELYNSNSIIFNYYLNPNACRLNFYIVDSVAKMLMLFNLDNTRSINEEYIDCLNANQ